MEPNRDYSDIQSVLETQGNPDDANTPGNPEPEPEPEPDNAPPHQEVQNASSSTAIKGDESQDLADAVDNIISTDELEEMAENDVLLQQFSNADDPPQENENGIGHGDVALNDDIPEPNGSGEADALPDDGGDGGNLNPNPQDSLQALRIDIDKLQQKVAEQEAMMKRMRELHETEIAAKQGASEAAVQSLLSENAELRSRLERLQKENEGLGEVAKEAIDKAAELEDDLNKTREELQANTSAETMEKVFANAMKADLTVSAYVIIGWTSPSRRRRARSGISRRHPG
jgi:DNA repair exonuclease SbcCD ATPase subunit